jgi:hypothetical protein
LLITDFLLIVYLILSFKDQLEKNETKEKNNSFDMTSFCDFIASSRDGKVSRETSSPLSSSSSIVEFIQVLDSSLNNDLSFLE